MKCVCEACGWEGQFVAAVCGFDAYPGSMVLWLRLRCPSCEEASRALLFEPEKEEPFLQVMESGADDMPS